MAEGVFEHRELMVSGALDRAILHLGLPAAMAALFQAGFLVVDTFWLGRVGEVAIAAASTAGFVMWLAQTLGEGAAVGSGAVLAHAVGAAHHAAARRGAAAGLVLAIWGSLLVTGVGLLLAPTVFAFMRTATPVTAAGLGYLRVILAGMPAYFLFAWIAAVFRAVGDARTPLWLLGLAGLVNVIIDPILIFGIGPVPRMETVGAALATVLSWLVAATVGWHLLGRLGVRPSFGDALHPTEETWRALRIGLPLGLEGALFSFIYIILTRITTTFGTPAVAALGVGHKLEVFNYFVCAGLGAAATTLVGQNLGAGDPGRARRAGWRTLFLTVVPVGAVTLVLVSVPAAAIGLFIPAPDVIAAGVTYALLVGISQPFMAAEVVLLGAFAGAHRTVVPAILQVVLTAARIPLAAALVAAGWGVEGVWAAISVTTVVKGLVLAVMFAAVKLDVGNAAEIGATMTGHGR
ncbi:MAG: MATE family efflux transporter [Acidobacteria bacterium]|jgi:putative MATE family efflux protein|nr:MATE family efflux transporter [Acidobacteriota bacterium]